MKKIFVKANVIITILDNENSITYAKLHTIDLDILTKMKIREYNHRNNNEILHINHNSLFDDSD